MAQTIKIKRGVKSSLSILAEGELGYTTDTNETYIGDGASNYKFISENDIVTSVSDPGSDSVVPSEQAVREALSDSYYTDSEAISAINNDADHGSTASHNYYTDSDVDNYLLGGTGISYSSGTISLTANLNDIDADTIDFNSEYDNGTVSASADIDWTNGNNQKITLEADITLTFSNMGVGHKQLRIFQDGTGGRIVTLPSGKWPGGTTQDLSTAASAEDILSIYYTGSEYRYQLAKGWA